MPSALPRPTDRATQLRDIARRLSSAARAGHWEALRHIDRELSSLLPHLERPEVWSEEMRQAMGLLQRVHQDAFARCVDAAERLSQRLSDMQRCRDGWMAYAQHSE